MKKVILIWFACGLIVCGSSWWLHAQPGNRIIRVPAGVEQLTDPDADRIWMWDDSESKTDYLTPSTGISISGTNLTTDDSAIDHDNLLNFAANEHYLQSAITETGTITSGTWQGTTIAVDQGGTGQTSYTDGQLLIGNTTGNTLAKAALTGTANQITVTNGSGSITLSTPQDIATGSSPTFANLYVPNGGTVGISGDDALWTFDSTGGDISTLDKVGIGNTSPATILDIGANDPSGGNNYIRIQREGSGNGGIEWYRSQGPATDATIYMDSNEDLRISNDFGNEIVLENGNVSIGSDGIADESLDVRNGGTITIHSAGNDKSLDLYHDDTDGRISTTSGGIYVDPATETFWIKALEIFDRGADGSGDLGWFFKQDGTNKWGLFMDDSRSEDLRVYDYVNNNDVIRSYTSNGHLAFTPAGNVGIGTTSPDTALDVNGAVTRRELSADPTDPDEGSHVIWQSDGTGSGDDGDIMMKITAGGSTKTTTLVDFSAL